MQILSCRRRLDSTFSDKPCRRTLILCGLGAFQVIQRDDLEHKNGLQSFWTPALARAQCVVLGLEKDPVPCGCRGLARAALHVIDLQIFVAERQRDDIRVRCSAGCGPRAHGAFVERRQLDQQRVQIEFDPDACVNLSYLLRSPRTVYASSAGSDRKGGR